MRPGPARRLPFIDGLRGIAILSVLTVHFAQFIQWQSAPFRTGALREFTDAGARGVQLFFMLSAFTLFASSRQRFATDSSPALNFYVRRAFRILPLWWAAVAFYAWTTGRNWMPDAFMYFGFIRYKNASEAFTLGWSIFVEESFYLLLPLVFALITDLYRAANFLAASCVVAVLWSSFATRLGVPDTNNFVFLFPLNQWFCIAIGIVLFYLFEQPLFRSAVLENSRWARTFDALTIVTLYAVIRGQHMAASLGLIALFIASASPHTVFGALARSRALSVFGIGCYSIYLFHLALIDFLAPHIPPLLTTLGLERANPDIRFFLLAPFFFAACGLLGLASWHGFERPCIALGARFNEWLAARAEKTALES